MSEGIYYASFVVDERPYCVWEWDLPERNAEFLSRVDPRYFEYLGRSLAKDLDGEDRQRAAVALRAHYAHGIEAFFSLLFAALQAPDCIPGWLLKYQLDDLDHLIKVVQGHGRMKTRVELEECSWKGLALAIHKGPATAPEVAPLITEGFAGLWARFAHDFTNEKQRAEFNSIKHGFRIGPGGFILRIGPDKGDGKRPPSSEMHSLGGSKFGSTFYIPEYLKKTRHNFRIRKHSLNWVPENHIQGLQALSISIGNVITFLKGVNGIGTEKDNYFIPSDPEYFIAPWKLAPGVHGIGIDTIVTNEQIDIISKEEILSSYNKD